MQRAYNLDSGGNFSGRLQLAETFIARGDNFREILVKRKGADIGDESGERRSRDARAETFDKCGIFLERRI